MTPKRHSLDIDVSGHVNACKFESHLLPDTDSFRLKINVEVSDFWFTRHSRADTPKPGEEVLGMRCISLRNFIMSHMMQCFLGCKGFVWCKMLVTNGPSPLSSTKKMYTCTHRILSHQNQKIDLLFAVHRSKRVGASTSHQQPKMFAGAYYIPTKFPLMNSV